ncbi:MAG: hybrid sensor histidine kinase/response regulator [Bdellovibrionota bacterium]
MIFLSIFFLNFICLSTAFFFNDQTLIYLAGSVSLFAGLIVLKDLYQLIEVLDSEVNEEVRSFPELLTTASRKAASLLSVLSYRKDALEWELGKENPSANIKYDDFTSLSTDSEAGNFYKNLCKKIQKQFRCELVGIVFEDQELPIYFSSQNNKRLERSLRLFFNEFFISGATSHLGLYDSQYAELALGDPTSFGFMYSLSESFIDSSIGTRNKAIIWLGYIERPLDIERIWLSDLAKKLQGELSAFQALNALSFQVQKIEQVNSQKTQFISHMSHDIRSPLNNIKSILHVLKLESLNTEDLSLIEVALSNCESVSEIAEDLLDYTRYQAGALHSQIEEFDICAVLKDVVRNYTHSAEQKNLDLQLLIEEDLIFSKGDRRQIKRVISNLVSNAIKYTEKGHVKLSACSLGDFLEIRIADSGIGISKEDLKDLFTPFVRIGESQSEGIGLGLALSKILIERNAGEIAIRSVPDQGSEFTLKLPFVCKSARKTDWSIKLNGLRIILVDDNPDLVESLAKGLAGYGCEVYKAHTAKQALELIADYQVDILVSDNDMPDGGARQLLKMLSQSKKMYKIIITGSSDLVVHQELLSLGADHIALKPVVAFELVEIFNRLETQALVTQSAA